MGAGGGSKEGVLQCVERSTRDYVTSCGGTHTHRQTYINLPVCQVQRKLRHSTHATTKSATEQKRSTSVMQRHFPTMEGVAAGELVYIKSHEYQFSPLNCLTVRL